MLTHKQDLEQKVLGAILNDKKQFFQIAGVVNPLMFSAWRKDAANHVWERMEDMNKTFDVYTLELALLSDDKSKAYTLYSIITKNGLELAYELQQAYYRAEETATLNTALTQLQQNELTYTEIVSQVNNERELRLSLISGIEKDPEEYINLAYKLRNPSIIKSGIPTGFNSLDSLIGGWRPGDYNVFAARPGMGKTHLMLIFILNAIESGYKPVLYSFEMTWEQIIERLACLSCGYNPDDILRFDEKGPEREAIALKVEEFSELDLFVFDMVKISKKVEEVCLHARRLAQKYNIDIVFIDYLQLLDSYKDGKNAQEYETVTNVSNFIRDFTKKTKIPVTALCQLNRSVEARGGSKRPQKSDLRGSGQLEQDATGLFFIYRAEYYHILEDDEGNSTKGLIDIIIDKHRGAGSRVAGKTIQLRFNPNTGRYTDKIDKDFDDMPAATPQNIIVSPKADVESYIPF